MSNYKSHGLYSKIPEKFGWVSDIYLTKVAKLKAKSWKQYFEQMCFAHRKVEKPW